MVSYIQSTECSIVFISWVLAAVTREVIILGISMGSSETNGTSLCPSSGQTSMGLDILDPPPLPVRRRAKKERQLSRGHLLVIGSHFLLSGL